MRNACIPIDMRMRVVLSESAHFSFPTCTTYDIYLGRVKQNNVFEHVQNTQIQIILRIRKVSSGPFLSIHKMIQLADSESTDQTARIHMPRDTFSRARPML